MPTFKVITGTVSVTTVRQLDTTHGATVEVPRPTGKAVAK